MGAIEAYDEFQDTWGTNLQKIMHIDESSLVSYFFNMEEAMDAKP